MKEEILITPVDLVAEALGAKRESVNDSSAMGVHPNWDSINHLQVIVSIEKYYHISIPNNEIMKYDNIQAIIKIYDDKTGRTKKPSIGQRLINLFKRS